MQGPWARRQEDPSTPHVGFRKSRALVWAPNSRALLMRPPTTGPSVGGNSHIGVELPLSGSDNTASRLLNRLGSSVFAYVNVHMWLLAKQIRLPMSTLSSMLRVSPKSWP